MDINADNINMQNKKEFKVKNTTNKPIILSDLMEIPSINPLSTIDLLNYTNFSRIEKSKKLLDYVNSGVIEVLNKEYLSESNENNKKTEKEEKTDPRSDSKQKLELESELLEVILQKIDSIIDSQNSIIEWIDSESVCKSDLNSIKSSLTKLNKKIKDQ